MPITNTPIRYPGGKTKLFPYVSDIFKSNNIIDGHYAEPYAGGAGLAISLLVNGVARYLHLNDLDYSIYSFWHTVLYDTDGICKYIENVNINMKEWKKQREIQLNKHDYGTFELGLSTLFLNRTNRSGIIKGGVIGGKNQTGKYKIDARFNKNDLIRKIRLIAFYKSKIQLHNCDAIEFINKQLPELPSNTLINLDPPYYVKGQGLYQNYYDHSDHENISNIVENIKQYWIITYDNVEKIKEMYKKYNPIEFKLNYSVQKVYKGKEVLIADPKLILPDLNILLAA
jgi:DNA adenine methylase